MAVRGVGIVPVVALGLPAGVLWWWAVLRLLFVTEHAGLVEGAVVAGGWGLSLLPVHVTASRGKGAVAGVGVTGTGVAGDGVTRTGTTRAWRRRRSGGGSGPS
ncbi:hypothetical protein [Streptomyces sp. NPDC019890]|uniref:hypothetical protein n=1 Tax=Streptomyces sp. NPDC019890 TaxID=3365064 RepID=UPI00384CE159